MMSLEAWRPYADEPEPAAGASPPAWLRPGPASEAELAFVRQPMVRWLDPRQLAGTAVRAVLSSVFGSYADRREMQAALNLPRVHCFDDADETWIDYAADLGDGFDSTYTVAALLGAPELRVGDAAPLPRGRILVLGGDQVYPTASRAEYENRFAGPYEAALPCHPGRDHPWLFAIPGNHDWYDGLTSFMRLFCQQRWIGGWRTAQNRSYFALQLPHRWWLLGTDFQLHADVDKPQLDFFTTVSARMQPGDRVILCTPEPSWVRAGLDADAFENLAFFERTLLAPRGAQLALTLAGDLHHYARYQGAASGQQKITSGGGGAYLYGTHCLPDAVSLETPDRGRERYDRKATYPARGESVARRAGAILAFAKNLRFSVFLALFYAFFAWILQSASMGRALVQPGTGAPCSDFLACVAPLPASQAPAVLALFATVVAHAPFLLFLCVLVIGALWGFCQPDPGRPRFLKVLGLVHGLAHVLLAVLLSWAFAAINTQGLGLAPLPRVLLFTAEMVVMGGALGGMLFGAFLLPGVNLNEAFSAQHIPDAKNFVRLHIDREGGLTVYPIGIARAARWKFRASAPVTEPWFEPDGAAPAPHFIEDPVRVSGPRPAPATTREEGVAAG